MSSAAANKYQIACPWCSTMQSVVTGVGDHVCWNPRCRSTFSYNSTWPQPHVPVDNSGGGKKSPLTRGVDEAIKIADGVCNSGKSPLEKGETGGCASSPKSYLDVLRRINSRRVNSSLRLATGEAR